MARKLKIDDNDELFELMTEYTHLTDNSRYDRRRAEILGIEAEGVTVAPGAIIRIPYENIGKGTFIGPHCSIVAGNHKYSPETGWYSARTEADGDDTVVIGDGCWLASGVTVTPGVKMGKCNLVCAGAVVTKSTPDYAILAGVPAKVVGKVDPESGKYEWKKG